MTFLATPDKGEVSALLVRPKGASDNLAFNTGVDGGPRQCCCSKLDAAT
jgi:hypothetical protein